MIDQRGDAFHIVRVVREMRQTAPRIALHPTDTGNVLVWRVRDDIYLAVTEGNPRSLRSRIAPAS